MSNKVKFVVRQTIEIEGQNRDVITVGAFNDEPMFGYPMGMKWNGKQENGVGWNEDATILFWCLKIKWSKIITLLFEKYNEKEWN